MLHKTCGPCRRLNLGLAFAIAVALLGSTRSQAQPVPNFGLWKVQLQGTPAADLEFNSATLHLSCGGKNTLAYRLIFKGSPYRAFSVEGGGDWVDGRLDYRVGADGILAPPVAAKLAAKLSRLLRGTDPAEPQTLMTPDGRASAVKFYGFDKVRAALRESCAKAETPPS